MQVNMQAVAPFATIKPVVVTSSNQDEQDFRQLETVQQKIVCQLYQNPMQIDELAVALSIAPFQLLCELTELELFGWVEPMKANRYRRVRAVRTKLEPSID